VKEKFVKEKRTNEGKKLKRERSAIVHKKVNKKAGRRGQQCTKNKKLSHVKEKEGQ
jgi:hypothetical protein